MTQTLRAALERVPEYQRFLTVQEMFDRARRVAEEHPDLARYQEVGRSTDGEPIPMVSIGDGPQSVVLFACPHPNEPIGAMLVQFLLDELVANESLREGRTWHLLPCVDPDGTRLNEGWFSGPFTVRNYARNFYRPRSEEQVEWTFPMRYKNFSWDAPIPETRSLMNAFELTRPDVLYSLHNAGFGGVYYYLSDDLPGAYADWREIPEGLGLFMALGEPEMPWAEEFAPAVYRWLGVAAAYDYFERFASEPPQTLIHGGGSSYDYARPISEPLMLITELPYFQSPLVSDGTPTAQSRSETILAGIARSREVYAALGEVLDAAGPDLTADTRFLRASATFIRDIPKGFDGQERWARETPGMDAPATVAQRADALYVSRFYQVLIASMLRRAIETQRASGDTAALSAAQARLEGLIEGWVSDLETNLPHSSIPIRPLVQAQYAALLVALRERDRRAH
jgi:hypothetical protein